MASKNTKRALLSSLLAVLLCFTMLLGTTFAWFTDSVSSTGNKIQSGTLKVDLQELTGINTWTSVKDMNDPLFNYTNWEPGYVQAKVLRVVNKGTLALKWKAMLVTSGTLTELADVIDVYVKEDVYAVPTDRDDIAGWTNVGTLTAFINSIESTTTGYISAKSEGATEFPSETLGIAFKMQESAGNHYQGMTLGGTFDIVIVATQDTVEKDSFDKQYDADAQYAIAVTSSSEIRSALTAGKNVALSNSVVMDPAESALILNKPTTIDLNNYALDASFDINVNPENVHEAFKMTTIAAYADLHVIGDGEMTNTTGYCINIAGGSTTVIDSGTFRGSYHAVYVTKGNLIINGGFFEISDDSPSTQLINAYDAGYDAGTANITITGGTYVNWNPADNASEGASTNFLASGYTVTSKTQENGDIWYTVIPA